MDYSQNVKATKPAKKREILQNAALVLQFSANTDSILRFIGTTGFRVLSLIYKEVPSEVLRTITFMFIMVRGNRLTGISHTYIQGCRR